MMTSMSSTYGTKNGVVILIPTIQKRPETMSGVIHSQYALPRENQKEETLTSCHYHEREKTTLKLKWNFRKN